MFRRCVTQIARSAYRPLSVPVRQPPQGRINASRTALKRPFTAAAVQRLPFKDQADELIEEIQDQYATAKDEFEIAMEETEKMTVYAEDDRKAAREELDKLKEMYTNVVDGPDKELGEEIKKRVGQRIRELQSAVENMEELAMNQD